MERVCYWAIINHPIGSTHPKIDDQKSNNTHVKGILDPSAVIEEIEKKNSMRKRERERGGGGGWGEGEGIDPFSDCYRWPDSQGTLSISTVQICTCYQRVGVEDFTHTHRHRDAHAYTHWLRDEKERENGRPFRCKSSSWRVTIVRCRHFEPRRFEMVADFLLLLLLLLLLLPTRKWKALLSGVDNPEVKDGGGREGENNMGSADHPPWLPVVLDPSAKSAI